MHSQRSLRRIARLALAWFALYLGAAVAAPLLQQGASIVVCSAEGMVRLVQADDAGQPAEARSTLHCPLCVPAAGPPPPHSALAGSLRPRVARVTPPGRTPWPVAHGAAPPPARGPPASA
jgi:hypothetical protein